MFTKLALAMALMAASITHVNAQSSSPLGLAADGTMRLSASEAMHQNYADIMNARLSAESIISTSSSNSSGVDLSGVSSKASAAQVLATAEVPLNADGTINLVAWNNATEAACQKALAGVSIASNPSGTGICYNLPALNISSGVFQADLRLYKLSTASGDFAGVASSNIQVQLSYAGASVSSVNTTANSTAAAAGGKLKSRDLDELSARDLELHRRENGVPMLKHYMLVGQIDVTKMATNSSMAALEALVMPTLTLNALASTGAVTTNVSSNEAVFVNGVFSREVVMSDLQIATFAVDQIHAELLNGTVAFVLPGIRLMTYPVGLIITSIWMVAGFIAYGIGTYDRFMYATSYRRQISAVQSSAKQTF